jgi:hypothetical protein
MRGQYQSFSELGTVIKDRGVGDSDKKGRGHSSPMIIAI